jgi:hypothetical protein
VTETPRPERVVIDGDTLSIQPATGEARSFSLAANPALGLLAATLRATLEGDVATLRRLYDIGEQGSIDTWRLLLMPRDAALRGVLVRITVDGAAADIRQLDIQQQDGGEQRLTVRTS